MIYYVTPSSHAVGLVRTPVRVQQGAGSLALFPGDDSMLGGNPVAAVRGAHGRRLGSDADGKDGCTSDVVCSLSTWPILSLFLRVVHKVLPH